MPHALEEAWRTFAPKEPPHLLPGDKIPLESSRAKTHTFRTLAEYTASDAFANSNDTSLHLGLLPVPFIGPLSSARVVILMLNPGLHPSDYFAETESQPYREALIANLRLESAFLWLNPSFAWHSGFQYWHGKFRGITAELASTWGVPYLQALNRVARRIAVVQLIPYHSPRFQLPDSTLDTLQSVRLMRCYVDDVLVPRAQRGELLIVVTRKSRYWKLPADKHILVYGRQEARSAHLTPGTRGGSRILEYLRADSEGATE